MGTTVTIILLALALAVCCARLRATQCELTRARVTKDPPGPALQSVIDAVPEFVRVFDRRGSVLLANQRAKAIESAKPKKSSSDSSGSGMSAADIVLLARVHTTKACEIETFWITDNRGERSVKVTATPLLDEEGAVAQVVEVRQDVTEQAQLKVERETLESQSRQAQKLVSLGVLAGGVAHDFNNILTAILGNAELAMLEIKPGTSAHDCLREVIGASRRASDLTNQMLAYSGRERAVVEPLDLSRTVKEIGRLLAVSVPKNIVIRYNVATSPPVICGVKAQLRQIIMNLITNASDSIGEENGQITISTGEIECSCAYLRAGYLGDELPAGRYSYVEVSDTGCGMSEETQHRLFDPLFTTKDKGRGLGLSAVLGIVRGHGGAIRINSEQGRGTTFEILMPSSEESASPNDTNYDEEKTPERPLSGTILLADDDEPVRDLGARALRKMGLSVLVAKDGREAVDLFRQHVNRIDCVILDLSMPRMNGEESLREILQMRPHMPVIMASGYGESELSRRLTKQGAVEFIHKPYRYDVLISTLRRALEAGGLREVSGSNCQTRPPTRRNLSPTDLHTQSVGILPRENV